MNQLSPRCCSQVKFGVSAPSAAPDRKHLGQEAVACWRDGVHLQELAVPQPPPPLCPVCNYLVIRLNAFRHFQELTQFNVALGNESSSWEKLGAGSQRKQAVRTAGTENQTTQAFLGTFFQRYLEKTVVVLRENRSFLGLIHHQNELASCKARCWMERL